MGERVRRQPHVQSVSGECVRSDGRRLTHDFTERHWRVPVGLLLREYPAGGRRDRHDEECPHHGSELATQWRPPPGDRWGPWYCDIEFGQRRRVRLGGDASLERSEEHTSELQS